MRPLACVQTYANVTKPAIAHPGSLFIKIGVAGVSLQTYVGMVQQKNAKWQTRKVASDIYFDEKKTGSVIKVGLTAGYKQILQCACRQAGWNQKSLD